MTPPALLGWTALAATLFLLPYVGIAWFIGPELPTLGGALFGGLVFVAILRRRAAGGSSASDPASGRRVARAAAPYLVLVGLVLISRLIPPVSEALRDITWTWTLPGGFSGSVQPLYHPGTMLLGGLIGGSLVQRVPVRTQAQVVIRTIGGLGSVTAALMAMLALSRIMVHAGLTTTLAESAASIAGTGWPLFAPLVGALGTFVTGSATASNILFTDFQVDTAQRLGLGVTAIAGAQGFGAAVGNTICPHNIVAASATVSLEGREGDVLRRTLWIAGLYAVLGGAVALVLAS